MSPHRSRPVLRALAAVGTVAAALSVSVTVASGRARSASSGPPTTLTGHKLSLVPQTLTPGTILKSSDIFSTRVFGNGSDGVALAGDSQGTDYAVSTTNGGTTWKINSPALFTATADGPNAVGSIGLAGPRTEFVYGPETIAVSTNGGVTWYRVYPDDIVAAVVAHSHGLAAYVQELNATGKVSSIVEYVSTDGGRHWKLSSAFAD